MLRVICIFHNCGVYVYKVDGNICPIGRRYLSNTSKTLTEKKKCVEFFAASKMKVVLKSPAMELTLTNFEIIAMKLLNLYLLVFFNFNLWKQILQMLQVVNNFNYIKLHGSCFL